MSCSKIQKTAEDLEYELLEIDDGLYVFNTVAFVGKNASGKTSIAELINLCLKLFGTYRVNKTYYELNGLHLEITFYHEGFIYFYSTDIAEIHNLSDTLSFVNEKLFRKKYKKYLLRNIFDLEDMDPVSMEWELPDDTSIIYYVMKDNRINSLFFGSEDIGFPTFSVVFGLIERFNYNISFIRDIVCIFDDSIEDLRKLDEKTMNL